MDDISWTDLNSAEQYAVAALGAGISVQLCDSAALRTLKLAGLIQGTQLTPKAEALRKAAASTPVQSTLAGDLDGIE